MQHEPSFPRRHVVVERLSAHVFRSRDFLTGRDTVIKRAREGGERELRAEWDLLASLHHPAFPRVVDCARGCDGLAWMVMEAAPGERPSGPMDVERLAALADGCCEALGALHARGLVHRDLKPDNVHWDDDSRRVTLLDLGGVHPAGRAASLHGTRGFIAPELLDGGAADERSDVYALGALLYEAAAGRPAFRGVDAAVLADQKSGRVASLATIRPDLPPDFVKEVARLMDVDPATRPATVAEARHRIAAALGAVPGAVVPAPELVGRCDELRALRALVAGARTRTVRAALAGARGSGRTRLVDELRCELLRDGVAVLVRSASRVSPLVALRADLEMLLDAPPRPTTSADDAADAAAALDDAAAEAARQGRTLVVAFDGIERAPVAVREAVDACARAVGGKLLFLVTCGSDAPAWAETCVSLGPLAEHDARALAAACGSAEPAASHLPGEIVRAHAPLAEPGSAPAAAPSAERDAAGGPAPVARRLAAALDAAARALEPQDAARVAGLGSLELAHAVRDLVGRGAVTVEEGMLVARPALVRLGPLVPEIERRAMHDALVETGEADAPSRLAHVADGTDAAAAVAACCELATAALERADAPAVRRWALAGLARLDELAESSARARCEAVLRSACARIHDEAGEHGLALVEHERAAARAREGGDPLVLARCLRLLAAARTAHGEGMGVEALHEEARACAEAAGEAPAAEDVDATLPVDRSADGATAVAPVAAPAADADPDATIAVPGAGASLAEARLLLLRGRLAAARGDAAAACVAVSRALERLRAGGEPGEVAVALRDLAGLLALENDGAGARSALEEAVRCLEATGDDAALGAILDDLAALRARAGQRDAAIESLRLATEAWSRAGEPQAQAAASTRLARELLQSGRVQAAVDAAQAALALLPAHEPALRPWRAAALVACGLSSCAAAEHAEALAACEEALELAVETGEAELEAEAASALGRIYAAFGSTRDGVRWQRRALDAAGRSSDDAHAERSPTRARARAECELGLLLVREGHLPAAARTLSGALATAQAVGDAPAMALAKMRLGRVQALEGELGDAERLVREGLDEAGDVGDRLGMLEGLRLLGTVLCEVGDFEAGLALLEKALQGCLEAGSYQDLPASHEALARGELRRALRLRTATGAIVDRALVESARAHVEKGLDLTVATGRMADRAALQVLAASAALMAADPRRALSRIDEAHRLALESGDLLVASRARLVRADALLSCREFGAALAEAKIACEALERSSDAEDAWRAHALIARVQVAWGTSGREEAAQRQAADILRRIEASLDDPRRARAFLADVERNAVLHPLRPADAARARRGASTDVTSERLAGRVDTEDLVEALVVARAEAEGSGVRLDHAAALRREAGRRQRLLRAAARAAVAEAPASERVAAVLEAAARACGGEMAVLFVAEGERLGVRARWGAGDIAEATVAGARRVLETGRRIVPSQGPRRRRTDAGTGEGGDLLVPVSAEGVVRAVLALPALPGARTPRPGVLRTLELACELLGIALAHAQAEEATLVASLVRGREG